MPAKFLAIAKLHWLDAAHGGRKKPPVGSLYAATGKFASDQDQLFSIVLRFLTANPAQPDFPVNSDVSVQLNQAELGFLAPELVLDKLAPGVKLLITEGPKTVAECEIMSVAQAGLPQAETSRFKNR